MREIRNIFVPKSWKRERERGKKMTHYFNYVSIIFWKERRHERGKERIK